MFAMTRPITLFVATVFAVVLLMSIWLYVRTRQVLSAHRPGETVVVSSDVCHALRWTGHIDAATPCPSRMRTVVELVDADRD